MKIYAVETQVIGEGVYRMTLKDHNGEVMFSGRGRTDKDILAQMPIDLAQQMVQEKHVNAYAIPDRDEMLVRAVKQLSAVLARYEPGDIDIKVESQDSREACGYEVSVFRKKMERII